MSVTAVWRLEGTGIVMAILEHEHFVAVGSRPILVEYSRLARIVRTGPY